MRHSSNPQIWRLLLAVRVLSAANRFRRPDLSGNFECALAVKDRQLGECPKWNYNMLVPNNKKQDIELAWDPILEPTTGCNGLSNGKFKQFSFLVVPDGSWVSYYNDNTQHFATQGYHSLETSANLMLDRVSYLYLLVGSH